MKTFKRFLILSILILINAPLLLNAAPKGKDVLHRPSVNGEPTEISMGVWLIDIDSIDSSSQLFVANIYMVLHWNDPSLIHEKAGYITYKLDEVWNPMIQIANEIGIVRKTLPEVVNVNSEGDVVYRQRYIGPFSQPLNLEDFPFDEQNFALQFASARSHGGELKFIYNSKWVAGGLKEASGISDSISLPDWKIIDYNLNDKAYEISPDLKMSGFEFSFEAERDIMHYVWKVLLPLLLIVMMSWSVFWIDPSNAGTQIGVATTSMLTLIAYRFAIDAQVPRVPYMTKLDQFTVAGTFLIFMSLSQVVLTSWLAYTGNEQLARRIDRSSRYIFPILFIVALAVSLIF